MSYIPAMKNSDISEELMAIKARLLDRVNDKVLSSSAGNDARPKQDE